MVYCLLVETNEGLILIDSGLGRNDYTNPSFLMRSFIFIMGIPRRIEETAFHQVQVLGFKISDVKHIVLTHLHLDHAGGLPDFPDAKVHVFQTEYEVHKKPRKLLERGFDPSHWAHGPDWVIHRGKEDDWYGFSSVSIIEGLEPDIRLVPLPGHTSGHCGIAVATKKGWLLQCGDAASPIHPASDLHGLDTNKHRAKVLPKWFVEAISGHDLYSYERYTSEKLE
jgi:glyoxylase-like metal-dependent hydrolase (beta-lactamase superfamily II)